MKGDARKQFGEELRQSRLQQGISLDEVARITKVRKQFLESLEAGRFEDLPPQVFVAGFLRAYARHLNIREERLVARYRTLAGEESASTVPYAPPPEAKRIWLAWAALAFLLAGGGGTLWWFQGKYGLLGGRLGNPPATRLPQPSQPPPAPQAPPQPQEASPIAQPEGAPSLEPQEPDSPSFPEGTQAVQAAGPSGADLVIETRAPCWVEISEGGARRIWRLMEAGERVALSGGDFTVTLGDRAAAAVSFRGEKLSPPEGEGPVVAQWRIRAEEESQR